MRAVGAFVALAHQLEEEHRSGPSDRQIDDLVVDEQARDNERRQPMTEPPGLLRLFERRDEIGQGAVVDPTPALGGGDGEADRQMALPHARGTHDVMPTHSASRYSIRGMHCTAKRSRSSAS